MVTAKINVLAIDKSRLFKGEKGTYLDIVLIDTPNGQYGDYMIVQGVTKEEREMGIKGPILGNGKTVVKRASPAEQKPPPAKAPAQQENLDEDVSF